MRIVFHNEKTNTKLTLKSDGPIDIQDVMDAHRIVTRESMDDLIVKTDIESERSTGEVTIKGDAQLEEEIIKNDKEKEVKPEMKKEMQVTRLKAVSLLNNERTLKTPLGSLADFSDHGIVYVDVLVECPGCRFNGDTTTRRGNTYTKCPQCDMKLFNSWATGNPNEKDGWGYEYHAREEIVAKESKA